MVKKPSIRTKIEEIMAKYIAEGAPIWDGRQSMHEYENTMANMRPAPHPATSSTTPWTTVVKARGPVGLLVQHANCMAVRLDIDMRMHQHNEALVDICDTPYQHMQNIVCQIAARARTKAKQGTKEINMELPEIDIAPSYRSVEKMGEGEAKLMRVVQSGGGWDKAKLTRIGVLESDLCECCEAAVHTTDHLCWRCPHFNAIRKKVSDNIAQIPPDLLPLAVRRGIAPVMAADPGTTYWGTVLRDASSELQQILGVRSEDGLNDEAKELVKVAIDSGCNARQIVAVARREYRGGVEPVFPGQIEETAPDEPNVYTDGSYTSPVEHMWALGGFGIWWPKKDGVHQQQHTDERILHTGYKEHGIMQYNNIEGQRGSSTRTEIAAVVTVMTAAKPVHMATDSEAMRKKAMILKEKARQMHMQADLGILSVRNPLRKPWALQVDGDLWRLYWIGFLYNLYGIVKQLFVHDLFSRLGAYQNRSPAPHLIVVNMNVRNDTFFCRILE